MRNYIIVYRYEGRLGSQTRRADSPDGAVQLFVDRHSQAINNRGNFIPVAVGELIVGGSPLYGISEKVEVQRNFYSNDLPTGKITA